MARIHRLVCGQSDYGIVKSGPGTPKGVAVDIARAVGTRQGQAWSPFPLETIDEPEEGGPVLLTDCLKVTLAMPLLSRRAREVLEPLFGDRVEHLPTVGLARSDLGLPGRACGRRDRAPRPDRVSADRALVGGRRAGHGARHAMVRDAG